MPRYMPIGAILLLIQLMFYALSPSLTFAVPVIHATPGLESTGFSYGGGSGPVSGGGHDVAHIWCEGCPTGPSSLYDDSFGTGNLHFNFVTGNRVGTDETGVLFGPGGSFRYGGGFISLLSLPFQEIPVTWQGTFLSAKLFFGHPTDSFSFRIVRFSATFIDTKSGGLEEVFGLPENSQYLGRMELEAHIPDQFGGWQGGPLLAGPIEGADSILTNTLVPEPATGWTVGIGLVLLQIVRSARRRRMIKE